MYSLTIEDETPLGKAVLSNRILYDFDKVDDMWLLGKKLLEKKSDVRCQLVLPIWLYSL